MKWAMCVWTFWAAFQGFFIPNHLEGFTAFEKALLALLANAVVAMAHGVFAIIGAIKAAR